MPQVRNQSRNDAVFAGVVAGKPYRELAATHGVSEARIDQIFRAEAWRKYPAIVKAISGGVGFRARFLEALKTQGVAA